MQRFGVESKTIYIENDETKQSEKFIIEVRKLDEFVNLTPLIESIPNCQKKLFEIYDPIQNSYVPLLQLCDEKYFVSKSSLCLDVVMIRYVEESEKLEEDVASEENKKERSRERTIKEVIEMVHRWRGMHDHPVDGKKMNLQEAAKIIGVSKKSLDDYYFQMRMGEKYGFDFSGNMQNKVGALRSFVKEHEQEEKKKGKESNPKQQKKLKIMEEFAKKLNIKDNEPEIEQNDVKEEESESSYEEQRVPGSPLSLVNSSHFFWGSPFSPVPEKAFLDCEDNFFKEFENIIDEVNDPFNPFTSFKKTKSIFGEEANSSSSIGF